MDDLSVLEIIPRCSTRMLPSLARDICSYASSHGMKLNPSKCKELRIDFLQYKPSDLPPLQMSGSIIEQVSSYKLLGVHLSHNLSWLFSLRLYCEESTQASQRFACLNEIRPPNS